MYTQIWCNKDKYSQNPATEINELAKTISPMKCLDLCAGAGRNTLPLLKQGHQVTVVDINSSAIQRLNELQNKYPSLIVKKMDARVFLETDCEKYDLIIVYDSIHHFALSISQLDYYLSILTSKLKKNGHLLLSFLADIQYPGGNSGTKRLYLSENQANDILDRREGELLVIKSRYTKKGHVNNAINVVNNQVVSGTYSSTRLVRLYQKRI